MRANQQVLGLDGGGTKTEWVLLESDATVVQQGVLSAANLRLSSDVELAQLFSVLPGGAARVGVFLAGCVNAADRARLLALAQARWPHAQIAVGSDRDSGFATAFRDRAGISVIAGTGSAVTGRVGERVEKAGGWGQLLGDRGGGYNLAVQALRQVLSDYDIDQRVDPLGEAILRVLALNQLDELVRWAADADKMSVARLAPVVFAAAANGHPEMLAAIQNGARILAEYTRAVASRLALDQPDVALLGGLFTHHPEYADLVKDYLSEILPGATVEVCARSGALGAAWLAARDLPQRASRIVEAPDAPELALATTEQSNPRSADLEKMSTAKLVQLFVAEEKCVAEAVAAVGGELADAIEMTSAALQNGGRLFYAGAGTSGRLGVLDASEIPPTFGASREMVQAIIAGGASALHAAVEGAEDQPEAGELAVAERGVTARDVVCGITASGRTPFVLGALGQARVLGARTILITCNPVRRRREHGWDVEIDLPTGPEIVTGSTRLKAGTATKVALNILSTCAMIRLGKVRGNSMIDLTVSNAKLRDRAIRQVVEAVGVPYPMARELLEKNAWSVRAALAAGRD